MKEKFTSYGQKQKSSAKINFNLFLYNIMGGWRFGLRVILYSVIYLHKSDFKRSLNLQTACFAMKFEHTNWHKYSHHRREFDENAMNCCSLPKSFQTDYNAFFFRNKIGELQNKDIFNAF